MKVCASKLQVGTVLNSGETVEKVRKVGNFNNVKASVLLKRPDGKTRFAEWGWWSTIYCKSVPS